MVGIETIGHEVVSIELTERARGVGHDEAGKREDDIKDGVPGDVLFCFERLDIGKLACTSNFVDHGRLTGELCAAFSRHRSPREGHRRTCAGRTVAKLCRYRLVDLFDRLHIAIGRR